MTLPKKRVHLLFESTVSNFECTEDINFEDFISQIAGKVFDPTTISKNCMLYNDKGETIDRGTFSQSKSGLNSTHIICSISEKSIDERMKSSPCDPYLKLVKELVQSESHSILDIAPRYEEELEVLQKSLIESIEEKKQIIGKLLAQENEMKSLQNQLSLKASQIYSNSQEKDKEAKNLMNNDLINLNNLCAKVDGLTITSDNYSGATEDLTINKSSKIEELIQIIKLRDSEIFQYKQQMEELVQEKERLVGEVQLLKETLEFKEKEKHRKKKSSFSFDKSHIEKFFGAHEKKPSAIFESKIPEGNDEEDDIDDLKVEEGEFNHFLRKRLEFDQIKPDFKISTLSEELLELSSFTDTYQNELENEHNKIEAEKKEIISQLSAKVKDLERCSNDETKVNSENHSAQENVKILENFILASENFDIKDPKSRDIPVFKNPNSMIKPLDSILAVNLSKEIDELKKNLKKKDEELEAHEIKKQEIIKAEESLKTRIFQMSSEITLLHNENSRLTAIINTMKIDLGRLRKENYKLDLCFMQEKTAKENNKNFISLITTKLRVLLDELNNRPFASFFLHLPPEDDPLALIDFIHAFINPESCQSQKWSSSIQEHRYVPSILEEMMFIKYPNNKNMMAITEYDGRRIFLITSYIHKNNKDDDFMIYKAKLSSEPKRIQQGDKKYPLLSELQFRPDDYVYWVDTFDYVAMNIESNAWRKSSREEKLLHRIKSMLNSLKMKHSMALSRSTVSSLKKSKFAKSCSEDRYNFDCKIIEEDEKFNDSIESQKS